MRLACIAAAFLSLSLFAQPSGQYLRLQGYPQHGYIEIPHDVLLDTPAMTVEAWVSVRDAHAQTACSSIVGKGYLTGWWVGICGTSMRSYFEGVSSVRTGGVIPDLPGWFYRPTLIADVDENSEIYRDEVFGPVLTVRAFTDDDDALRQANDTVYGLAASAWTRDVYRAQRASREINAGCVWINDHIPIISEMPHGGLGASGFGKDMSDYSFEEYLTVKHVMSDISAVAEKDWHRIIFSKR